MRNFLFVLFMLLPVCLVSGRTSFRITDFGAVGDGRTLVTDAINHAIDSCNSLGGGTVMIPAGKYVSGTVVLKDNVTLLLDNGAVLMASLDDKDFPAQYTSSYRSLKEGKGWYSLIYAENAHHIAISGNGVIDGRGRGRKGFVEGVAGDCNGRPRNILFISCKDVTVSGVEMRNSALWNQHYLNCEDVLIDKIRVYNHCNGNNDGIDIDGCRRLIMTNCIIDSDDDGIVLKSTGQAPCEHIVISNCIVSSYANAIKCGTESTGGFRNIMITDCMVIPSRSKADRILKSTPSGITAISLEIVDGGIMDGVKVDNIQIEGTECPVYVRLANRGRRHIPEAPLPPLGKMRNIHISNITAVNCGNFGSSVTGIGDAKIENISLLNWHIIQKGGLKEGNYRSSEEPEKGRHDIVGNAYASFYWKDYTEVKEDEKGYPQPTVWGNLPCYGLFLRHVKDAEIRNIRIETIDEDPRVPVIADDVDDLKISELMAQGKSGFKVLLHQVKSHCIGKDIRIRKEK